MSVKTFVLAWIYCNCIFTIGFTQCRNLDFEDGVRRKLLSPDLFNIQVNADYLGCPKFNYGDSTLCGSVVSDNGQWDIGLPDGLLFTILFQPTHYKYINSIFKDPFFVKSLNNVPQPSVEILNWFEERRPSNFSLVQTPHSDVVSNAVDEAQKKLITVFYSVKSWTYCPEEKKYGLLTVHGIFDESKNVIIYNSACKASNIYQSNVSDVALAFRLFFVCGHEFSHAIDKASGLLPDAPDLAVRDLCEKRANVNGLIFTRAFARLFQQMLIEYKSAIQNCTQCLPCDKAFLKQTIKKWEKLDDFFKDKISTAKAHLNAQINTLTVGQNKDWSAWACMEPQVLGNK